LNSSCLSSSVFPDRIMAAFFSASTASVCTIFMVATSSPPTEMSSSPPSISSSSSSPPSPSTFTRFADGASPSGPSSMIFSTSGLSLSSSGIIHRETRLVTSKKNCLLSLVHTTIHGVPDTHTKREREREMQGGLQGKAKHMKLHTTLEKEDSNPVLPLELYRSSIPRQRQTSRSCATAHMLSEWLTSGVVNLQ
jgi:hypothetical protein